MRIVPSRAARRKGFSDHHVAAARREQQRLHLVARRVAAEVNLERPGSKRPSGMRCDWLTTPTHHSSSGWIAIRPRGPSRTAVHVPPPRHRGGHQLLPGLSRYAELQSGPSFNLYKGDRHRQRREWCLSPWTVPVPSGGACPLSYFPHGFLFSLHDVDRPRHVPVPLARREAAAGRSMAETNPACPPAWHQPKDIDAVLVTHAHGDHMADAVGLAKRHGRCW